MWERGDKTNQGIPEINVSSIGMAKVSCLLRNMCCISMSVDILELYLWNAVDSTNHGRQ